MLLLLLFFYQLQNGNYIHKVKKLINSHKVENTGQSSVMLEEAVLAVQLECG